MNHHSRSRMVTFRGSLRRGSLLGGRQPQRVSVVLKKLKSAFWYQYSSRSVFKAKFIGDREALPRQEQGNFGTETEKET